MPRPPSPIPGDKQYSGYDVASLQVLSQDDLAVPENVTSFVQSVNLGLPDGTVLTGRLASTYVRALDFGLNDKDARDVVILAGIAEKVSIIRANLLANPGLDSDGKQARQLNIITSALLAKDSYFDGGIDGLLPDGVERLTDNASLDALNLTKERLRPKNSTFGVSAYLDTNRNTYVIAFKGTASREDTVVDLVQGLGIPNSQYSNAAAIGKLVRITEQPVEYTGHSLGGGLASLAALVGGTGAVTFNAAGLNPLTGLYQGLNIYNDNKITAIYTVGEALTTAQIATPLPDAAGGTRIGYPAYAYPTLGKDGSFTFTQQMSIADTIRNTVPLHFQHNMISSIFNDSSIFR